MLAYSGKISVNDNQSNYNFLLRVNSSVFYEYFDGKVRNLSAE